MTEAIRLALRALAPVRQWQLACACATRALESEGRAGRSPEPALLKAAEELEGWWGSSRREAVSEALRDAVRQACQATYHRWTIHESPSWSEYEPEHEPAVAAAAIVSALAKAKVSLREAGERLPRFVERIVESFLEWADHAGQPEQLDWLQSRLDAWQFAEPGL